MNSEAATWIAICGVIILAIMLVFLFKWRNRQEYEWELATLDELLDGKADTVDSSIDTTERD